MKNIFAFIIILSFFITSVVKSENNSSHAIAMHGKPKYSENFCNKSEKKLKMSEKSFKI